MPPHLHPRSRMTSSLFATTVAASFFVVGLPHILPCPAPRVKYADSEVAPDGTRRRRRRKPEPAEAKDGIVQFESPSEDFEKIAAETGGAATRARKERECPVPKPGGVIGNLMGFNKSKIEEDKKGTSDNT
ncbi:uncharacterized protein F4807DRAFT_78096 [Annulohypoxylon truncatum]|uniref:uncharacterized protein n=1 Tax=Annulohypoxylon truncatum TaxID=327061 RepID=UPI002008271E|nr:uncharacterized protein F4807DRAFT_78096 [Annulohypoxylon truncatum]KAI1209909.1 hypothetical protein F4807DRAFT_78096 [Annulohypoxylon truncatum]